MGSRGEKGLNHVRGKKKVGPENKGKGVGFSAIGKEGKRDSK